jgi:AcrR family transcriptional regulator
MARQTRKEREKARHREFILEAAEAVFAERGYNGATVQEIAERAEFSVGYLYTLFENKEDVYVRLVELRVTEFLQDLRERLRREEDILEKVRVSVRAKFEFFRHNKQFFHIFTHFTPDSRARGPVFMPESCREQYQGYLAQMADIFRQGMRQGLFAEAEPVTLVLCLDGMTKSVIAHSLYTTKMVDSEQAAETIERVFFRGILAGSSEQ